MTGFVLVLSLFAAGPMWAADEFSGSFAPAMSEADLDLAQCRAFVDGKPVPVKKQVLLSVLGLEKEQQTWTVERQPEEGRSRFEVQYLIIFKHPVPAGLLEVGFVSGSAEIHYLAEVPTIPVQVGPTKVDPKLKAKSPSVAATPTRQVPAGEVEIFEPKSAAKWPSINARGLFPPGARLKALSITNITDRNKSELQHCLVFQERMASVTAAAVGSGEKAPFGSNPDAIPQGQGWRNTGMDDSPGAVQRLQRGAVSTALPSWYLLSWDEKQSFAGVLLESNAEKFELFTYVGDARANPALAGPKDWKRLPFEQRFAVGLLSGDKLIRRCLEFKPTETTAIKLEMTDCGGTPVAAIDRFDAMKSLGNDPAPTSAPAVPSPFAITYEQPFAGTMAMVIEDAQGRRVRNLLAQVERQPGEQIEGWDLKDEASMTVPPGDYRYKVLTAPPLDLKFALTAIPTGPTLAGRTPWQRGDAGPDGWMADHATHTSGIACGDKIYFGAPGVESGVSFIECNLKGHKLWAKHNFAGFTGLKRLASDGQAVYIYEREFLERMEPSTHEITRLATLVSPTRKGEPTSMAAHQGQVYLSFHGQVPMMDNATLAGVIDLENSTPKYPKEIPDVLGNRRVEPNPRVEFLRLLRLTGMPAGQPGNFNAAKRSPYFSIYLESSSGSEKFQYVCLAFNEPVPLGSVVFPTPDQWKIELFTLKQNATYPPDLRSTKDWTAFATQPTAGWECLAAPANTLTRALLVRFTKPGVEEEGADVLDLLAEKDDAPALPDDLDSLKPKADLLGEGRKSDWFGRLEGMKLLRRRFQNLSTTATVRVNSGEVNEQGEWNANRTAPITSDAPGIYVMEWKAPQQIAGLAIKEIDGAKTCVDVWIGPDDAEVTLEGDENWKQVAIYEQARRDAYEPSFDRNSDARYIDGYVDFHENRSTKAIRLRVIEQWADLGDRGTATLRTDRGGRVVDARRCSIYGVSALEYLGGEVPVDAGVHQRIEVRDGTSGDLLRDLAGEVDHGLSFNPAGTLFGVRAGQVVQIDKKTGKSQNFLKLKSIDDKASGLTIDADGFFYVVTQPRNVIDVFDVEGQFVRTIGKPFGQPTGYWDPLKFSQISDLFVAADKSLWIVESQYLPRRIVQYKTDGTFVQELIGNTNYGGAGVLNRYDKSRLFQSGVEYAIDWKSGQTRIKSLLGHGMPAAVLPIKIEDRLYLTSAPFSYQSTQPVASIYLLAVDTGKARLVAAFGEANAFDQLKQGGVLALLEQGKALRDYRFVWSDTNGNGAVDAPEVALELKTTDQGLRIGRLDRTLGAQAGNLRYEVEKYLPNGTPVYAKVPTAAAGDYRLDNGNTVGQRMPSGNLNDEGQPTNETQSHTPDGSKLWGYFAEHESVSGLWVPPWSPGYVTNEFGIIGHETTDQGDLGEFFVIHANNGQWKVWSADGMLAGNIMYHLGDPRSRTIQAFDEATAGTKLDHLTAGQEHFNGHFTKSDVDGKYYAVFGHNYISLLEVAGLDRFKRMEGTITVGSEDVRRVRAWESERARRVVKSNARQMVALEIAGDEVPITAEVNNALFGMAYDQQSLFLRWRISGHGELKNTGEDFQRTFKTGAALDFQMSTDSTADPSRSRPVRGDFRLLITMVKGKPRVVLYQPVNSNASADDAWETRTEAGGVTAFDRVVLLKDAKVVIGGPDRDNENYFYDVTAAVPLASIGLKIEEGLQLKMDWGVLTSETGDAVRRRIYWSNELANGTTDEAIEARLEPQLWGSVVFQAKSPDEQRLTDLVPVDGGKKSTKQGADLLKEIEDDLK